MKRAVKISTFQVVGPYYIFFYRVFITSLKRCFSISEVCLRGILLLKHNVEELRSEKVIYEYLLIIRRFHICSGNDVTFIVIAVFASLAAATKQNKINRVDRLVGVCFHSAQILFV